MDPHNTKQIHVFKDQLYYINWELSNVHILAWALDSHILTSPLGYLKRICNSKHPEPNFWFFLPGLLKLPTLINDMLIYEVVQADIRGTFLTPEVLYPINQHILFALSEGMYQLWPLFTISAATKQGNPPIPLHRYYSNGLLTSLSLFAIWYPEW